jgi:tryptophan halogenase
MDNAIRSILVVGGGTSGWLAAVFLSRLVEGAGGPPLSITLVESSDIGTVGVGEATIPSIKNTFAFCGIDERDWIVACNSSFKMAIKYTGWRTGAPDDVFWHPFGRLPSVNGIPLSHYWLSHRLNGGAPPYDLACTTVIPACEARRGPKLMSDPPFQGQTQYAYHLDAGLLASYLKQIGKSRGVRHVVDNVRDVVLDQRGFIDHVTTDNHGDLHADLFIDSSGFRGLLINEALEEPFISFGDALFCDRAVAVQIPSDSDATGINPYTSATALSAGWVWNIPLFHRVGTGYVYCSRYLDQDQAEQELRAHIGHVASDIWLRHLKMRVGHTRNAWVKNCVSIGLASGFIEPLESTGIWFAELGLYNLAMHFPNRSFEPGVIAKYNEIMRRNYQQIRDFLVLHYCTTSREDTPFWHDVKHHPAIPDSLQVNLEAWRAMLPNEEQFDNPGFFKEFSIVAILAGMEWIPSQPFPLLAYQPSSAADASFAAVQHQASTLEATLPDHYSYLAGLHA